MNYFRDKVNKRIKIREFLVKHKIRFKDTYDSYRVVCPFHDDRNPSCNISKQMRLFHCFGCGEKGDVVYFIARVLKKPIDAVIYEYALKFGIDFPSTLDKVVEEKEEIIADEKSLLELEVEVLELYLTLLYIYKREFRKLAMKEAPFSDAMVYYYDTDIWIMNLEEHLEQLHYDLFEEKHQLKK